MGDCREFLRHISLIEIIEEDIPFVVPGKREESISKPIAGHAYLHISLVIYQEVLPLISYSLPSP